MKEFNLYIERYFDGYTAHTLYQDLTSKGYPAEIASNWIYAKLYRVFAGRGTQVEREIVQLIRNIVFNDVSFSDKENLFISELQETKYCIRFGYKYNASYLKNNALDFYIKGSISLTDFQFIVSLT